MKYIFTTALVLASLNANAEVIEKYLKCDGDTLEMALQVMSHDPATEVITVAWQILDNETRDYSQFMGYLNSANNLINFSSTDLGSSVSIEGHRALVHFKNKKEVLICQEIN